MKPGNLTPLDPASPIRAGMKFLGFQEIDSDTIDLGERLRPISVPHAMMLADNIREAGRLRSPIEVRLLKAGKYRVIAGGHRKYATCDLLKWPKVTCAIYECSEDAARIAEIDENIVRHELNPLDRAVFLAERKAIWERLHPETKRGGNKNVEKSKADSQTEIISVWSFARETAEKCGLTDRTIRLAVAIAQGLTVETRAAIAGTYITHKQSDLVALSKLTPAQQKRAVTGLLGDDPKWHSVNEALAAISGRVAKPVSGYDRLVTAWNKASAAERKQFRTYVEGPAMRRAKEAA